jgi:hypothetical protein
MKFSPRTSRRHMGDWRELMAVELHGFQLTRKLSERINFINVRDFVYRKNDIMLAIQRYKDTRGQQRVRIASDVYGTCFPGRESPRLLRQHFQGNRNTLAFIGDFSLRLIRCTVDVTAAFQLFRFIDLCQLVVPRVILQHMSKY